MLKFIPQGMGWIPDLPDARDYTYRHEAILPLLAQLQRGRRGKLPDKIDLRFDEEGEYFTPADDQGSINCASACAAISLIEYFERRIAGRNFEGSRLFLYKVTRNRLQKRISVTGDTGADLRTTLKVLMSIGVPPEDHWPFDVDRVDVEPGQFVYSLAKPLSGVSYFRLDEPNSDGDSVWATVTAFLAAGFPVAFGFSVPASLTADADIPYRPHLDSVRGGQAAVAVGYQQHRFGRNQHALFIRSSWGSQWGDNGNGWLPFAFVRQRLARDFWTLISPQWLDSGELSQPHLIEASPSKRRRS